MKKLILSFIALIIVSISAYNQCDTNLFDSFEMTFEEAFEHITPVAEFDGVYLIKVKGASRYDRCYSKHDAAFRISKNGHADVFPDRLAMKWSKL